MTKYFDDIANFFKEHWEKCSINNATGRIIVLPYFLPCEAQIL